VINQENNSNVLYVKVQLFEKIQVGNDLKMESRNIKNRLYLYKLALNAAKEYYNQDNSPYKTLEEALSKVLINNYLNKQSMIINGVQIEILIFF
jgi:hypothetical protein